MEFLELWKQDPRCRASQKITYLSAGPETISAGLDRVNNLLPHTIDNVRIMSTACNEDKGRMTLSMYRQKRGLSPVMNSNYSDELFRIICGSQKEDKKAKAWIGLVQ
eukprot:Lithocolla_globosa_v1_NODE_134_length_5865_cov_11.845465.p6 type:complete len:107 gc:universal NODE_134_length_5865_cov_11.845465:1885-2205(+)